MQQSQPHWLDRYGHIDHYRWRSVRAANGGSHFARHLGLVESSFDHDGTDFVGRADVSTLLTCEVQSLLSYGEWRAHVLRAWAALRAEHALLRARAVDAEGDVVLSISGLEGRCFAIEVPKTAGDLLVEAEQCIVFLEDYGYGDVEKGEFYRHCMNTARCFDASRSLSRLFVLPLRKMENGSYEVTVVGVFAHQIMDGLTSMAWNAHFLELLNLDDKNLEARLGRSCNSERIRSLLPSPQEDLYPTVAGTNPLARWKWAISRILRHTRIPPLDAFQNPLKRNEPLKQARRMQPVFDKILDYSIVPPLNCFVDGVSLPLEAVESLRRLCREAKASIGAGSFALVGLVMSELEEERNPLVPLDKRLAFVASFPLDARPFIHKGPRDSIMLAFSDGMSLPFLPSYLPVEGRFKLLARLADRQLQIYQKKPRSAELEIQLGSRSSSQFIPSTYLGIVERLESKLPPHRKRGINPQGDYIPSFSKTGATCGVSSLGNLSAILGVGKHALDSSKAFAADFRSISAGVRARDGEFLVGASGNATSLGFSVSYDANSIDEDKVQHWKRLMTTILMPSVDARL